MRCPESLNVAVEPLDVGQSRSFRVWACNPWNSGGILLEKGANYTFRVDEVEDWRDQKIKATPEEGWPEDDHSIWNSLRFFTRCPKHKLFTLIGTIGKHRRNCFLIGSGRTPPPAKATGPLFAFANDAPGFYGNNHGHLTLTVTRER